MPTARKLLTVDSFNQIANRLTDKKEFIELCKRGLEEIGAANTVTVNPDAVRAFAAKVTPATGGGYGWNDYISPQANKDPFDLVRVFHEMAAITGQNGGYFYPVPRDGLEKWEINGSGATAMVKKMEAIRADISTPGFNSVVTHKLALAVEDTFKGLPFANWRSEALMEFMPRSTVKTTQKLLEAMTDKHGVLQFNMASARKIAKAYPHSFGNDPFAKKAILLMLQMAAHIDSRSDTSGKPAYALNTIAAIDYRLPQTLSAKTVEALRFSPRLTARLKNHEMMGINDPDLVLIRCGTAVALDMMDKANGRPTQDNDSACWIAGKRLEKEGLALPALRLNGPQF